MLLKPNTNVVEGAIVGPDGALLNRPTTILDKDEAAVIRAYKKIKAKYGFREENRCSKCWTGDRDDGMRGHTTDFEIIYECRCRMLFFRGQTF